MEAVKIMETKNITLSHLATLSTADLLSLADEFGIDIPENLNRSFVIRELLETAEELQSESENEDISEVDGEAEVLEKKETLPETYNETEICAVLRNPAWVFVYWDISAADMVVLPGGKVGTANLSASELVSRSVLWCVENDRYVAAICAAPSVLGGLGVLQGRRATCFPGWEDKLTGAVLCSSPAVQDGKIITGRGAGASLEFGFQLVEALRGAEAAQSVRETMQTPSCR